ncbi:hypothetical protein DPEC_G00040220 [Dallia pectoralis]|uniref:Uncharacterized protein n=1 Tax=Dallia pectoralis TaxID=75939 RepID=A0ACC2HG12_DALPE|nr:hypothetical protein DPEC_G00040220 [Dallia pectoralis]
MFLLFPPKTALFDRKKDRKMLQLWRLSLRVTSLRELSRLDSRSIGPELSIGLRCPVSETNPVLAAACPSPPLDCGRHVCSHTVSLRCFLHVTL